MGFSASLVFVSDGLLVSDSGVSAVIPGGDTVADSVTQENYFLIAI